MNQVVQIRDLNFQNLEQHEAFIYKYIVELWNCEKIVYRRTSVGYKSIIIRLWTQYIKQEHLLQLLSYYVDSVFHITTKTTGSILNIDVSAYFPSLFFHHITTQTTGTASPNLNHRQPIGPLKCSTRRLRACPSTGNSRLIFYQLLIWLVAAAIGC